MADVGLRELGVMTDVGLRERWVTVGLRGRWVTVGLRERRVTVGLRGRWVTVGLRERRVTVGLGKRRVVACRCRSRRGVRVGGIGRLWKGASGSHAAPCLRWCCWSGRCTPGVGLTECPTLSARRWRCEGRGLAWVWCSSPV